MTEGKSKFVGEVLVICLLQFIMLLFRLVEPIHWPGIFPGEYTRFMNEFVYFGIELGLIIVIVAHFIFKNSFKDLGLTHIKDNIGGLIINICFLGVSIGVAYLMSQFSRNVELHLVTLVFQVITNFIAIAFLKELIFRGFLFNALNQLISGKGIIASLITAFLFTMTYIPGILVRLSQVSTSAVIQALVIPFAMGIYLSLLYNYSRNLWMCTIIHGVLISLQYLEQDFAIVALEGVYVAGLIIYLIYKVVKYYKGTDEIDELDHTETTEENQNDTVPNAVTIKTSTQETGSNIEQAEQTSNTMISTLDDSHEELDQTVVMPALPDDPKRLKELVEAEKKVEDEKAIPDLLSVLNTSIEDDDLEQNLADLNTREELNKAVHLDTKSRFMMKNKTKNIEKNTHAKVISLADRKRQREEFIKAEPNFIAHLEKYLGEFETIYKQIVPTEKPIDVLCFKGNEVDALVTNGMRGLPMNVPSELKDYENVELMMFIDKQFNLSNEGLMQDENAWIIKLLTEMANYPSVTNGYLGWGNIVGNGEKLEPYDEHVGYCGALVYPPINQQDVQLCHYEENGVKVFIYNVMPLYKEELSFIQGQSSEQFVNLMVTMGINQTISPKRMNVVKCLQQL